tara:strand:- start:793 stop:1017 length:225 start_codon:yes stop_codon:yes gene_type:complete
MVIIVYHLTIPETKYHHQEYSHLAGLSFMVLEQEYYQKKVFQSHTQQSNRVVSTTKTFLVVFVYLPVILGIDLI